VGGSLLVSCIADEHTNLAVESIACSAVGTVDEEGVEWSRFAVHTTHPYLGVVMVMVMVNSITYLSLSLSPPPVYVYL